MRIYNIILYTNVGPGFFLRVQNFEFQYFWRFQKTEYLLGYEDFFCGYFLGSSQNWTIKVQTGGFFGLLKF